MNKALSDSISSNSSNSRFNDDENKDDTHSKQQHASVGPKSMSLPCKGKTVSMTTNTSASSTSFEPPVLITPLHCTPNTVVKNYLGNVNLFFIRESTDLKEVGGVPLFIQQFIAEVHAIISAHVLALGGNAILSFNINEILLIDSAQKNEAQCLINVSGDAAEIHPESEDLSSGLYCDVNTSRNTSGGSSPATPDRQGIVFKLDRAVYGTNV